MPKPGWRDGVRVVRAAVLQSKARATAFDFAGSGGQKTWIGIVTMQPRACTGPHHHGIHEVALYVPRGRTELRWGERLEFRAELGPGDFAYFTPGVPHQELNPSEQESAEFVVVRSDNSGYVTRLETVPAERPESVF
jgi:uncharacterized RmlC-like cupin family protein